MDLVSYKSISHLTISILLVHFYAHISSSSESVLSRSYSDIPFSIDCLLGTHSDILAFDASHLLVFCANFSDFKDSLSHATFPYAPVVYFVVDFDVSHRIVSVDGRQQVQQVQPQEEDTVDFVDLVVWSPLGSDSGGGCYLPLFVAAAQLLSNDSSSSFPSLSSPSAPPSSLSRLILLNLNWVAIVKDPIACTPAELRRVRGGDVSPFAYAEDGDTVSYLESLLLCPDVLILGTTQIAYHASLGHVMPLTSFLLAWKNVHGSTLQDDTLRFYFYDIFINGLWHAMPLITDVRLLYYNKTTFKRLNLRDPPPLALTNPNSSFSEWTLPFSSSWSWQTFVEYAAVIQEDVRSHSLPNAQNAFSFYSCVDEESKLLSMMSNNAHASLVIDGSVSQTTSTGLTLVRTLLQSGMSNSSAWTDFITNVLVRMYNVDQSATLTFATVDFQDPAFQAWLNKTTTPSTPPLYVHPIPGVYPQTPVCRIPNGADLYGMAIESVSYSSESLEEIGAALVPGTNTFLGGTVIALSGLSPSKIDVAGRFLALLVDSSLPLLHELNVCGNTLPPYQSALAMARWSGPEFALVRLQLTTSTTTMAMATPSEYPYSTFARLVDLQNVAPMRSMMVELVYKRMDVALALNRMAEYVNYILLSDCSNIDYAVQQLSNGCSTYSWNQPKLCRDGVALPQSTCQNTSETTLLIVTIFFSVIVVSLMFVVVYFVSRYRVALMNRRPTRLVLAEEKWRNQLRVDMLRECVSIALDVVGTVASFVTMLRLLQAKQFDAFVYGYVGSVVSSSVCSLLMLPYRGRRLYRLNRERTLGVAYRMTSTMRPRGDLQDRVKVDDPHIMIASVSRRLDANKMSIISFIFSSLPFFVLNHILLFNPPSSMSISTGSSVYISVFVMYALLGFKFQLLLELRSLSTTRDELLYQLANVDKSKQRQGSMRRRTNTQQQNDAAQQGTEMGRVDETSPDVRVRLCSQNARANFNQRDDQVTKSPLHRLNNCDR